MLKDLFKNIIDGRVFCGLEYSEHAGDEKFYGVQLIRRKNSLEELKSFEVPEIEDLGEQLKKQQALFLVINTSQVITKSVGRTKAADLAVVNKAFPNLNMEDFYYEVSEVCGSTLVSICRKPYVDEILEKLEAKGFAIIGCSLALHQLRQVEEFLPKDKVHLSNTEIVREEDDLTIHKTDPVKVSYNVNGIKTASLYLLSLSAALMHFFRNTTGFSNLEEQNASFQENFYQKRFFRLFSRALMVLLLIALLINFFVFNHYYQKVEQLKQTSEINTSNKEKLMELNALIARKEKLVEDVLSSSASRSSLYLDEIASEIPETLLFTEIDYQPLKKKIKKDKEILLHLGMIDIYGQSTNSDNFSLWIEHLESLDWVLRVDVEDYGFQAANTSFFKIKVRIADE